MGSYVSARKDLEALVKKEGEALVTRTAYRVLRAAQNYVPQPGQSKGYATGALKAAMYVANAEGSGYEAAIQAAGEAPDTRILQRNQIEPEEKVVPVKNVSKALVAAPLSYANLVHGGFHHIGGFRVQARPFLAAALYEHAEDFEDAVKGLVDMMQLVNVTTAQMRQQRQRDAYYTRQRGSAQSQVRESRRFANQRLRAKFDGAFVPARGETLGEMHERMESMKQEIIDLGNLD